MSIFITATADGHNQLLRTAYQKRLSTRHVTQFLENIDNFTIQNIKEFIARDEIYKTAPTGAILDYRTESRISKIRAKIDYIAKTSQDNLQKMLCEISEPFPPIDCEYVENPLTLEEAIAELPYQLRERVFTNAEFSKHCAYMFQRITTYKAATTYEQIAIRESIIKLWYVLNRVIRAFEINEESGESDIAIYFRTLETPVNDICKKEHMFQYASNIGRDEINYCNHSLAIAMSTGSFCKCMRRDDRGTLIPFERSAIICIK
jgi:hypothetical protein